MEDGVDSQACGCGLVLMSSDYHNNQSSGSLSEHQPVQRLQILQFNFLQGCAREYSRVSTSSAYYNSALCRSGFLLIPYLIVIIH